MGSLLYEFLNESLLLDRSLIDERFAWVPENELERALGAYREFCLSRADALTAEVQASETQLSLFGGNAFRNELLLRQAALYLDTIVLADPLFELSCPRSEHAEILGAYVGTPRQREIDREKLAKAAAFFVRARSLVAADYVKFFPSSYYFEPPIHLPLRGPEATFRQSLPDGVREIYEKNVMVRSLERTAGSWRELETLHPSRGIIIRFGEEHEHAYGYHLLDTTAKILDEETRHVLFESTLPETPPSVEQFDVWVAQSVDRAVEANVTHLETEVAIAVHCKSMYVTDSRFSSAVLDAGAGVARDVHSDVARQVFHLELPILEGVGLDDLMRIRVNEGDAFVAFRRGLERQLAPLRLEDDTEKLRIGLENVSHELSVGQVADARRKIVGLQRKLGVDVAIGAAGLVGTMFTSGYSLAATVIALATGARDFADYRAKKRENPGYFLWKAMKASTRK